MYSAIELQHKLTEAQGIEGKRIKPYTASSRFSKDVESLSKIGMCSNEISYTLDVPKTFVQQEISRIARAKEARRRYVKVLEMPIGDPGYLAIINQRR